MIPPRHLAALYALFATLALLLVALTMPPFQNADEQAHAYRADQISHGEWLGHAVPVKNSGGDIDAGLPFTEHHFDDIPFHRERKVTREMYVREAWGPMVAYGFPNTVLYPPIFYLPAAAALAAARSLGLPILFALHMARLATGAVTIAITTLAILLAEQSAIWIFAMMLLPMSLSLTAALSQDAPMLAVTALAIVLCRSAWRNTPPRAHLLMIIASLTAVAMARPPYAAFALLLLGMRRSWRARIASFVMVYAGTLIWSHAVQTLVMLRSMANGVVDPAAQLHRLLTAPWLLLPLARQTWHDTGRNWIIEFIGYPGWLDVDLPPFYHKIALGMLVLAAGLMLRRGLGGPRHYRWLVAAAIFGASAGIVLIQYLTWTMLGAMTIDGVQGRYFLSPALVLGVLAAGSGLEPASTAGRWAQASVALFPVISIAVLIHAILLRYYI